MPGTGFKSAQLFNWSPKKPPKIDFLFLFMKFTFILASVDSYTLSCLGLSRFECWNSKKMTLMHFSQFSCLTNHVKMTIWSVHGYCQIFDKY